MPTLRTVGGAGGAGSARRRSEYDRPEKTPIATIRATDTALMKAGVERGNEKKPHNSRASRGTDDLTRCCERACPPTEQIAIPRITR